MVHQGETPCNRSSWLGISADESRPAGFPEGDKPILTDIDNPLIRLSPGELVAAVQDFAETHRLEDIKDLLVTGAKVARDPEAYESVPGLMPREKAALKKEKEKGLWRQTKELRVTIITCAIAAIIQGWDQSSINGANLDWPREFGLHVGASTGDSISRNRDVWIFGLINAAPFLVSAICGAWLSDPINEYIYGRRPAIFVSGFFCFASVVGSACTHTWQQLLACRILLGLGMGVKSTIVPIFAAEVSPAHIRGDSGSKKPVELPLIFMTAGSLVMNWQLFDAFGIFLGFSANLAVFDIKPLAWRLQLAAASLPALPLLFLIFVCPESPRFLIKKGNYRKAYESLRYLNETPLQAARELYHIHAQVNAENQLYFGSPKDSEKRLQSASHPTYAHHQASLSPKQSHLRNMGFWRRVRQLGSVARIRRALFAAFVVQISQQLCGVNVIAFYSSSIFIPTNMQDHGQNQIASDQRRALWLGWGFGLTNFIFAWPAYGRIDRRGRRFLLLFTIPWLAVTLLAAGFAFKIPDEGTARIAVITFFVILFGIFYSPGLGPVPFTYSAEVFPLVNREVGMSFAVAWNLLGAGVLSLTVPFLNNKLNATGLLGVFAGLNVLAFVLVFFFVYETKEATLEELNSIFSVSTKKHIEYQLFQVLPWLWSTYVTRTVKTRLDPAYRWKNGKRSEKKATHDSSVTDQASTHGEPSH